MKAARRVFEDVHSNTLLVQVMLNRGVSTHDRWHARLAEDASPQ